MARKPFEPLASITRITLDMSGFYQKDATLNGLDYDIDTEERAIELFAENIMRAVKCLAMPLWRHPFIPSWSRVLSAIPDIGYRLRKAVEEDNRECNFRLAS